jgi:hypothetical protein
MVSPHLAPNDKFSIVRASPAAMVKMACGIKFPMSWVSKCCKNGFALANLHPRNKGLQRLDSYWLLIG